MKPNQSFKKLRYTYRHNFDVRHFTHQPSTFAGKNTIFSTYRASFFLLNLHYSKHLRIVTNNTRLREIFFSSDRRNPNRNYVFGKFINGVFRFLNFHRKMSSDVYRKYFKIVLRHLHEQFKALSFRLRNTEKLKNNNQTQTYFRFSVDKNTYYFGFYVPCSDPSCDCPPTFVSKQGSLCWNHWKVRCSHSTPHHLSPRHTWSNVPKNVTSARLGISYSKQISFSNKRQKYYVVLSNFKSIHDASAQQSQRFSRLTRSPRSNDFKKLITLDKANVVYPCHHGCSTEKVKPMVPPPPSSSSSRHASSSSSSGVTRVYYNSATGTRRTVTFESQIRTFIEPEEWRSNPNQDTSPICEVLPLPEGFKRRKFNKDQ